MPRPPSWANYYRFSISMKLQILIIRCGFAAILMLPTLSPTAFAAAAPKPDRLKARYEAIEASLVPKEPIPRGWLQEPMLPVQVIQELEDAWVGELASDPPVENQPGKKNNAVRKREREDSVDRRNVFLACFDKHKKGAAQLLRFNGGPGEPFGYVIIKQTQAIYWYPVGTNAAP
jgi:hypothetical protein